jgi:hypothetical protein
MTKLMFLQASPRSTESKSIEIAQVYSTLSVPKT